MEQCLHAYFIADKEVRSCCDFIPSHFESEHYVYEVIRVIEGCPLFLEDHIQRLGKSCEMASISKALSESALRRQLNVLIEMNQVSEGNVKIMMSSADFNLKYVSAMWFIPASYPANSQYLNGVPLALIDYQRQSPQMKLHRPDYKLLISKIMNERNVYELLLVHDNLILEGSRSNVFFINRNTVFTAPETKVLSGITRMKVIDCCRMLGIPLVLRAISPTELTEMEAAFLSGTSPKVLAINRIDEFSHFNPKHEIIKRITGQYNLMIQQTISESKD